MVSFLRSILPIPRSEPLQSGPYWASTPAGSVPVSTDVPPAALMAAGTVPPAAPEPPAALVAPELIAPELIAPELIAPELIAPELIAPELIAPELIAPELIAPELIAPELIAPELIAPELIAPELIAPELIALVEGALPADGAEDEPELGEEDVVWPVLHPASRMAVLAAAMRAVRRCIVIWGVLLLIERTGIWDKHCRDGMRSEALSDNGRDQQPARAVLTLTYNMSSNRVDSSKMPARVDPYVDSSRNARLCVSCSGLTWGSG